MKRFLISVILLGLALSVTFQASLAGDDVYTRTSDVVYGRKEGMALTMDVFTPKKNANGAAVIWVVSGGWFSSHAAINPKLAEPFIERGYTVFAVVHGSQPRFTIPEILPDMNALGPLYSQPRQGLTRSIRIASASPAASAGGHLSLMQGTGRRSRQPEGQGSDRTALRAGCKPSPASSRRPIS